jgi:outer membrane protein TolC
MRSTAPLKSVLAAALAALPGALGVSSCSADYHARRADHSVQRILPVRAEEVLGDREEQVVRPLPAAVPDEEGGPEGVLVESAEPAARVLSLREALALAVSDNRDYRSRQEDLYVATLGLVGVRHAFSPQLSALVTYAFSDVEDSGETRAGSLALGASQILGTGGTLAVAGTAGHSESSSAEGLFDSDLTVRLAQPLLRGAGYAVSHEPLVQAERNLIYAIRDFELFREDFSIDVATRFYGLVQSKRSIDNQRESTERFTFARRQAEAFFEVGRANELNYLRARREELNSQDALIQAEEDHQLELDRFRIFLGLPEGQPIDVLDESPEFVPVSYDADSAARVALTNRLDVLTSRERLQDSERNLRLAEHGLLPDLGLNLAWTADADPTRGLTDQQLDQDAVSAALTLELPVDRVSERNALRVAQISFEQARRSLDEFEDGVVVGIKSALRELERREQSVAIQRELIRDEEKNLRIAELQFEQGRVDNRDVVEAQQSLTAAKNGLIAEQVSYELARLRLLRDLGILFIDEGGMWRE